jgi:hypothetical protein
VDLVQILLGMIEQDDQSRTGTYDALGERGANRASGAGDQDRLT